MRRFLQQSPANSIWAANPDEFLTLSKPGNAGTGLSVIEDAKSADEWFRAALVLIMAAMSTKAKF